MKLLELTDIHTYYGHIHALKGISLHVEKGEIVTLIGANGAGKTTALRTISGMLKPKQGAITLSGESLVGQPAHKIVEKGIGHVPEGRGIFPKLTVQENLTVGAFIHTDKTFINQRLEFVFSLFPRLRERLHQYGGTLSGGEQQMLAMGRGLMMNPSILLLDEPSMGLAPVLVESIFDIIERLHEAGTTILLVEQNALMALQVANRGYVLQSGQIVLEDTAEKLRANEMVRKVYLGEN
ncbi:MAG: ABC transporter ATP-binding protein [Ardenticatenales bacterium]|nr:ABC transporter ATP-binding protein [Ardenticatenales bacterium]